MLTFVFDSTNNLPRHSRSLLSLRHRRPNLQHPPRHKQHRHPLSPLPNSHQPLPPKHLRRQRHKRLPNLQRRRNTLPILAHRHSPLLLHRQNPQCHLRGHHRKREKRERHRCILHVLLRLQPRQHSPGPRTRRPHRRLGTQHDTFRKRNSAGDVVFST